MDTLNSKLPVGLK